MSRLRPPRRARNDCEYTSTIYEYSSDDLIQRSFAPDPAHPQRLAFCLYHAMLSIFGRAGATPLVVAEKPVVTVDHREANTARSINCI